SQFPIFDKLIISIPLISNYNEKLLSLVNLIYDSLSPSFDNKYKNVSSFETLRINFSKKNIL
ncbi:unnamed protein product, partial [marine sediment metagenome]